NPSDDPTGVATSPAKKLGGYLMSFASMGSAALSALALVGGFGPAAARPADAAPSERTVIRIGAVIDQPGGSTSPLYRAAVELAAAQMNAAIERSGIRV